MKYSFDQRRKMVLRNEEELDNIRSFLIQTYNIDIESSHEMVKPLIQSCLNFFVSLYIWKEIYQRNTILEERSYLLKEGISSVLYMISFAATQMKLPFLMMFQRLLDLIQYFFMGTREDSSNFVDFSLFFENTTDYEKILDRHRYPLFLDLQKEIFAHFNHLKESVSSQLAFNKVHYFSNEQWLDLGKINYFDICYLTDYIDLISTVFNAKLILLDFDFYMREVSEQEKSHIRNAMNTPFEVKKKIVSIFSEI